MFMRGAAMHFRIGFLLLALLIFAGSPQAEAKNTCASIKPFQTKININLIVPQPDYIRNLSLVSLQKKGEETRQEWLAANGLKELWKADGTDDLPGMATGGWAAAWDMPMRSEPVDSYGVYYCLYFEEIALELFYRTMIAVPKNYKQGGCTYNTINVHEIKHHMVNKQAIELYVDRLRADVMKMIEDMEAQYIPENELKTRLDEAKNSIKAAVDIYLTEYMTAEMARLNGLLDSPEEQAAYREELEGCLGK